MRHLEGAPCFLFFFCYLVAMGRYKHDNQPKLFLGYLNEIQDDSDILSCTCVGREKENELRILQNAMLIGEVVQCAIQQATLTDTHCWTTPFLDILRKAYCIKAIRCW